jgi:hypothetical protein
VGKAPVIPALDQLAAALRVTESVNAENSEVSAPRGIMSASDIARRHYQSALQDGAAQAIKADAIARAMLSLAIATFLESRPVEDVRGELLAAAENVDPDTDYMFMRP